MGSSFALALHDKGHTIVGSDRDPAVVLKAVDRRIVEGAHSDLSMVDIADIVVIAAPGRAMRDGFKRLAGKTAANTVTDTASTKAVVLAWRSPPGVILVAGP